MNRDQPHGWEHFQFKFTGDGVKVFSPEHKKYLRSDNGQLRCDGNEDSAIVLVGWYVPNPNKRLNDVPSHFMTKRT